MEQAVQKMKKLLATDVFYAHPNQNLHFDIYTDASDFQLGAVIVQGGCPVAYYSKKLNAA